MVELIEQKDRRGERDRLRPALAHARDPRNADSAVPHLAAAACSDAHAGSAAPSDEIPGTYIFDGALAMKGYALNKMCYSFNDARNREAFKRNADAYCAKFGLTDEQRDAVQRRDVLGMIRAGGNVYYLAKLAGIFGYNVQDIGAQQTGMTVEAFRRRLEQQGAPHGERAAHGEGAPHGEGAGHGEPNEPHERHERHEGIRHG